MDMKPSMSKRDQMNVLKEHLQGLDTARVRRRNLARLGWLTLIAIGVGMVGILVATMLGKAQL